MKKDLITIKDLSRLEIEEIFRLSAQLKKNKTRFSRVLSGKTLALIFQKPSNRTRVSFAVGMYQLGGNAVYLGPDEINLGVRESVKDVAQTLSRYVDGIVLRTFAHKNVLELAEHSRVPVINGLSDHSHPCQALADVFTIFEKRKSIKGLVFSYVGDGNNVCNSLIYTCAKLGIEIRVATPKGYGPDPEVLKGATQISGSASAVKLTTDPVEAVSGADVVYTDVWASMGQESEAEKRKRDFQGYQLNAALIRNAKPTVAVMHCLPAHRGQEITDEVIDGPNSVVFDQAENRLHVQKALLVKFLK